MFVIWRESIGPWTIEVPESERQRYTRNCYGSLYKKYSLGLSSEPIFFSSRMSLWWRDADTQRSKGLAGQDHNITVFSEYSQIPIKQNHKQKYLFSVSEKKYCALASNHKTPNQRNRFPESRIAYIQQQITTEKIVVHIHVISVSNDVNCLDVLLLLFSTDSNAHSNAFSNSMSERWDAIHAILRLLKFPFENRRSVHIGCVCVLLSRVRWRRRMSRWYITYASRRSCLLLNVANRFTLSLPIITIIIIIAEAVMRHCYHVVQFGCSQFECIFSNTLAVWCVKSHCN